MEVENVGENPVNKSVNKKKWIILFSTIGVLIVGLVVAIVVVLAVRNNNSGSNNEQADDEPLNYDELSDEGKIYAKYMEYANEISHIMIDQTEQYTSEDILKLYRDRIDLAENEKVKALLASDYYMMMLSAYSGDERKDEILNGLIDVDNVLQTSASAITIVNAATYFNDEELVNKYNKIAYDRMGVEEKPLTIFSSGSEGTEE